MKPKYAQSSRPVPRHSSEYVKNKEHLDTLEKYPDKFAKLSAAQRRVLGRLYAKDLENRGASVHMLGTTYDTVEALEKLRILTLKGTQRSWAYITYYGRRMYEALYWHEEENLERRREKTRAKFTGKRKVDPA